MSDELDQLCINTVRFLSVDAVQQANSGHPGLPLGAAAMAYVLWTRLHRHNPRNPNWFDRDRFVLSAGHGSMLLYSLLHLTGYDLSLDDIKQFRQWGSKAPGHPERGHTPGVETTTGPLGQGLANAVGMAIAEAQLAACYNRPGFEVIDHATYALVSDGDLMEGVAAEAASLAGHLKLGKLICLYDDNRVTLAAGTDITLSEDRAQRFEAYGWHTLSVADGNDLAAIDAALRAARAETARPSLILARTHIGYGSPNKHDSFESHGSPLGVDEVCLTKQNLGWPTEPLFLIPEPALAHFREALVRGARNEAAWNARMAAYTQAFPELAEELRRSLHGELPADWDADIPVFPADAKGIATRVASGKVMNAIAPRLPALTGGSADLDPSTHTALEGLGDFHPPAGPDDDTQGADRGGWSHAGRNLHFGVREHAMGAIVNGLAAHGGFVPYGATFLIFSDYMRPAIRLAALMGLHVVHLFTHDSIALGEDGPTHQPVEQLAALRAIPNLTMIRPADANETAVAWKVAVETCGRPVLLVLSRQDLPTLDRSRYASADGLRRGAYVLSEVKDRQPALILIASGSEVGLILTAAERLQNEGVAVRCVSMPSWELFEAQPQSYRDEVLPPSVPARLAVELGVSQGWYRYVGDRGDMLGIERFGASAPADVLLREYGFTVNNVVARARALLASLSGSPTQPHQEASSDAVRTDAFSSPRTGSPMPSLTPPPDIATRRLCLLSNGTYSVMLSNSGSGFSRWRDLSITRWHEDATRDSWGSYLLLRDEDSDAVWSATRQPLGAASQEFVVNFSAGRAEFARRDGTLDSTLEIAVAGEADIELRRLTLNNHGDEPRSLSLTSYTELVVGPAGPDHAHPAFSKMFVRTEWDAQHGVLLATRRRRADSEPDIWAAHALQIEGQPADRAHEHETDRARFLGRCRTLRNAQAMQPGASLSNTTGYVLDPIFSLRQRVTLAPGASVRLLLWTRLADSREGALALTAQLDNANAAGKLFTSAARHAVAEHTRLCIDAAQAARFAHWLSAVLISDPRQRAPADVLARGRGGPPTLWAAGISGDRPIVLLRLDNMAELPRVQELLRAQNDWRSKQLAVDVVLLNTATDAAGDALHSALEPLVSAQQAQLKINAAAVKAELIALRDSAISDDVRSGLLTVARVLIDANAPPPAPHRTAPAPGTAGAPIRASTPAQAASAPDSPLEFFNGSGGFSQSDRAYRIHLDDERCTPVPWVNVIANPAFGFLVSAEGGGYAWSLNSQQNPITPWPNDPVSDSPHEVLYLRDEDSGALWSATALPIRVSGATYHTMHGKGASRFSNDAHGIESELTVCVPVADPIKLSQLRLCNRSVHTRRLSITGYVEWALGANGTTPAPFVITSRDEQTGALFARNPWRSDFDGHVAFVDLAGQQRAMSGDRGAFLGSFGALDQPAALQDHTPLSGHLGAGLDPCGALQTRIELPPNTQIDIVFLLGDAACETEAQTLIAKYRATDIEQVLGDVAAQWNGLLDTVQVRTPDRAMDIMLNDWLLYQVLSCRVWARSAYYQASGAYGFRDQLQDVMALCVSRPDLAREHLLRAAGRQFAEGDVQHWWLPPGGQGIRTKISDDRIWLTYVATHYVDVTGDAAVLDEVLPYLVGQVIPADATTRFFQPTESDRKVSVYEHCARALDSSLTRGAHGLPLIGTGDWNDGMNSVGEQGRGESSWLGWFLLATIAAFAPYAERRGETARVKRWRDYAADMRVALEQAWDGQWYRRGYYDDGTPLGSHESGECQIDTIAQSWSVLAGAANPHHAAQAMASVDRLLVDHQHQLARLFTPPFDNSTKNPGYIKAYPPGVRENGGQYTHGAIWSVFAWARLGDGDRAGALFDLLNPIHHSDCADAVARYKVEPYVACADVYSVAPYLGRGGWTWYTGSAAWLYRAGLEAVLGFQLHGDQLRIDPCIPKHWAGFQLTYRRRGRQHAITRYVITVENPGHVCRGITSVELDAKALSATDAIALADDGQTHTLRVVLG